MADGQKKEIIKKRFGRYLLLDHLVDGGMAKICRARHLGEQADKIVAIKMIQSQFSADEAFRTMFMDEIKVAFGLIHPNICQTYDYGMIDSQLFTVMEYVDGKNLKQFLDKLRDKKFVFPAEICLHITAQACQALHYAHTLTDKLTGTAYKIVHRDISPHNLMITYDGAVKVIDFGIAKASTNSEATQAGTIKGKLSYLAPEYLEGLELDHRYDQFALGITLWEMLCNRKLFKAENDLAVLKQIQACKIPPPSTINPNVPKALDDIILKALSKDREKRFKDMDAFNRELVRFLYSNYQNFNPSDLAYFAKDLFQEEIKVDRERFFEFGKIDMRPYLDEMKAQENGGGAPRASETTQVQTKKRDIREFELDEDLKQEITAKRSRSTGKTDPSATRSGLAAITIKKKGTTSADKTQVPVTPSTPPAAPASRVQVRSQTVMTSVRTPTKKTSITDLKARQIKGSQKKEGGKWVLVAALACLAIAGTQYQTLLSLIQGEKTSPQVSKVNTDQTQRSPASRDNAPEAKGPMGSVRVVGFDKFKHRIFLNGSPYEPDILGEIKMPVGEYVLRVEQNGMRHFVSSVRTDETSPHAQVKLEAQPPESYGQLFMTSQCANGKIRFELFGEKRLELVPFKRPISFPTGSDGNGGTIPANYEIAFKKDGENFERKLSFTINYQDDSVDFCSIFLKK